MSGASESAGAAVDAAQNAASSVADMLSDVIQDRPIAAVSLALGVGFIMGVAWRW